MASPLLDFFHRRELSPETRLRMLRELAAWYREFAERAGDPRIWNARLLTSEQLTAEADRLEAELLATACDQGLY
jgi:hypothetical protein